MADRNMEDRTYTRFTVRVLCTSRDVMDEVRVVAEDRDAAFTVAEAQHDEWCGSSMYPCSAEADSVEEGWEEDTDTADRNRKTYRVRWSKAYYASGFVEIDAESADIAETIALENIGDYEGSMEYDPDGDWVEHYGEVTRG